MLTNFDLLKERDAELYKLAQAYTGCKAGLHKLDSSRFPADVWERLVAFVNKPTPDTARAVEPQRDLEADTKTDLDRAAANGRFLQLQDEEGLIDCEANAKMIGNFFQHHKLPLTVKNVNTAVEALRPSLAWRPKLRSSVAPAAPPPVVPAAQPAPAAEVLGLVAGTNEPQLSLESSEYVLRRASKAQVADWLSRKRAVTGKYIRPSGVFGSKF